jgi:hypothetical protein
MQQITPGLPTWFDWLTVAAIVLGPILALLSQRLLDYLREKRQQRLRLFMTLISTARSTIGPGSRPSLELDRHSVQSQ